MTEQDVGFEASGELAKTMAEIKLAFGLKNYDQVAELALGVYDQITKESEDGAYIVAIQKGNPVAKVLDVDALVNARARKLRQQIRLLGKD